MKEDLKRKAFFAVIMAFAFLSLLAQPASADHGAIPTERTWGGHSEWELLEPVFVDVMADASHAPLYGIAAIDASNAQSPGHGDEIGPHDHVIPVPPKNRGTYSAIWHVFLVVPGPAAVPGTNIELRIVDPPGIPLVYKADLGAGLHDLKTAAEVELAASLGLVVLVDIGVVFVCPIRPAK